MVYGRPNYPGRENGPRTCHAVVAANESSQHGRYSPPLVGSESVPGIIRLTGIFNTFEENMGEIVDFAWNSSGMFHVTMPPYFARKRNVPCPRFLLGISTA